MSCNTLLLLDSSYSMNGPKLRELQRAVYVFLERATQTGLPERVSLTVFGQHTETLCGLTNEYAKLKEKVKNMKASGGTPMYTGLELVALEIRRNARIINESIGTRVILMTDGKPNRTQRKQTLSAAESFGQVGIPIACVGVQGCDVAFMKEVAQRSRGVFIMANNVTELSNFFVNQILLTLFLIEILQAAEREQRAMEEALTLEALRQYMSQQRRDISEEDLLALFLMLWVMAQMPQDQIPVEPTPKPPPGTVSRIGPPPPTPLRRSSNGSNSSSGTTSSHSGSSTRRNSSAASSSSSSSSGSGSTRASSGSNRGGSASGGTVIAQPRAASQRAAAPIRDFTTFQLYPSPRGAPPAPSRRRSARQARKHKKRKKKHSRASKKTQRAPPKPVETSCCAIM